MQVELVMYHFRNVNHAKACMQLQKPMAESGTLFDGFFRFHNIIQRRNTIEESETSLLENSGGKIFVKTLKQLTTARFCHEAIWSR